MSLYAHIDGKEDLLDGVVAQAFEEFPPPPPGDWRDQLTALARGYRSWALARPAVFALLGSRPLPISEQLKLFDLTVGLLTEVGFTSDDAMKAFHALGAFLFGSAMAELQSRGDYRKRLVHEIEKAGPTEYPASYAAREGLEGLDAAGNFEFGLDALLNGLELAARRCKKR